MKIGAAVAVTVAAAAAVVAAAVAAAAVTAAAAAVMVAAVAAAGVIDLPSRIWVADVRVHTLHEHAVPHSGHGVHRGFVCRRFARPSQPYARTLRRFLSPYHRTTSDEPQAFSYPGLHSPPLSGLPSSPSIPAAAFIRSAPCASPNPPCPRSTRPAWPSPARAALSPSSSSPPFNRRAVDPKHAV